MNKRHFVVMLLILVLAACGYTTKMTGTWRAYPDRSVTFNKIAILGQMSNYLFAPGYYTGSVYVFLETNIFEFPEGNVVWSGQSETSDITDLENSVANFFEVVVKELIKSKSITP